MKNCSLCNSKNDPYMGISILKSFICELCLAKISKTKVDDPEYHQVLDGIKKVWRFNDI